jgi:hypothetical protein
MEAIMADVIDRPAPHPDLKPANTISINKEFLRVQAAEALATFFAPFSGVVIAAKGKPMRRRRAARRKAKREAA